MSFCSEVGTVYLEMIARCGASLKYYTEKKLLNVCELFAMTEHNNAEELYY
jgi:hypothetical protein